VGGAGHQTQFKAIGIIPGASGNIIRASILEAAEEQSLLVGFFRKEQSSSSAAAWPSDLGVFNTSSISSATLFDDPWAARGLNAV